MLKNIILKVIADKKAKNVETTHALFKDVFNRAIQTERRKVIALTEWNVQIEKKYKELVLKLKELVGLCGVMGCRSFKNIALDGLCKIHN